MRFISLTLGAVFLIFGISFGALNSADAVIDFYRWKLTLPLGVALIGFSLLGAMAGGLLLWATVIWPQRRRINALNRQIVNEATRTLPVDSV